MRTRHDARAFEYELFIRVVELGGAKRIHMNQVNYANLLMITYIKVGKI